MRFKTVLLAACLGAGPVFASPPALPPITAPASQERHPGKDVFVQLVTPDIGAAQAFYGGLFGWQFTAIPGTRTPYSVATLGGVMVGGILQKPMPENGPRQPAWLGFFSVSDVGEAVAQAVAHGGKVLAPAHEIPGLGTEAVLADPQGAVFGVLTSASGDPPDTLKPVGAWIWRSLLTSDAAADTAFYQALFGFKSFGLPSTGNQQHILLASGDYARATANTLPAARPGMHPHWLNFVRVTDASQAAAKAVALGGKVLMAAHPDRHGGMVAVVADPQGAPVGLFEWADGESKELPQ